VPQTVTAYAPASIGNLGVGFDMLGLALEGAGDRVIARRTASSGVTVADVRAPDGERHAALSSSPGENTASIAAAAFWREHGDGGGVELDIRKGVPLRSGMGSSAASAVAGVVAANALLDEPLPHPLLMSYALEGERYASGGLHADNVAPSLLGGLVLCPPALLPDTVSLRAPDDLRAILVHPDLEVSTAESRAGLAQSVSVDRWLEQQGYLAAFVAACASGDIELLARSLRDVIVEPQRAGSVACFGDVKQAASDAGALGCSLSGSGPSIFALARSADAPAVAAAMEAACRHGGLECERWTSGLNVRGAYVEARGDTG
jgi:homoserine kinase